MSNVINMSGGAADLQSKTVNPSTSQQIIRPDTGKDGLSQVTVNAIKLQSKSVSLSASAQTIQPDSNYNGLSSVYVPAARLQYKKVDAAVYQEVAPDVGYYGLSSVVIDSRLRDLNSSNLQMTGSYTRMSDFQGIWTLQPINFSPNDYKALLISSFVQNSSGGDQQTWYAVWYPAFANTLSANRQGYAFFPSQGRPGSINLFYDEAANKLEAATPTGYYDLSVIGTYVDALIPYMS